MIIFSTERVSFQVTDPFLSYVHTSSWIWSSKEKAYTNLANDALRLYAVGMYQVLGLGEAELD